jgi:hypothetical protein
MIEYRLLLSVFIVLTLSEKKRALRLSEVIYTPNSRHPLWEIWIFLQSSNFRDSYIYSWISHVCQFRMHYDWCRFSKSAKEFEGGNDEVMVEIFSCCRFFGLFFAECTPYLSSWFHDMECGFSEKVTIRRLMLWYWVCEASRASSIGLQDKEHDWHTLAVMHRIFSPVFEVNFPQCCPNFLCRLSRALVHREKIDVYIIHTIAALV